MKILFAFYPLFVKYNHGVALLSSLCKQRGIQTALSVLETPQQFTEDLERENPDYVGFSAVFRKDYEPLIPFTEIAKGLSFKTLLGGVYPRRVPIVNPHIDYICRGEAEILPDFLLEGDTTVFDTVYVQKDINCLPLPDYELFKSYPFVRKAFHFFDERKVLPYYSSRGCPFRCTFCERRYQTKFPLRFRYSVRNDLDYLMRQYRPDVFFIGDELLPYYNDRWMRTLEGNSCPFACYIRADIERETLIRLHANGLMGVAFGVESGDMKYRNEILLKDLTDKQLMDTVDLLRSLSIRYVPFYMVGTPGETPEMRDKTLQMADRVGGDYVIWVYDELNPLYEIFWNMQSFMQPIEGPNERTSQSP